MPVWVWLVVGAIVVEAIVLAFVFTRVKLKWSVTFAQLGDLKAFTSDLDRVVTGYMNGNYGGQPSQLPAALAGLLDTVRGMAAERRLTLDEEVLRALVVQAVAARKFAGRADAESAMESVPRAGTAQAA
jgi:hypothetical protein